MTAVPDHLRAAVAARTDQANAKASAAITRLAGTGQRVTFASVAREAGVSTDFLYRHHDLRVRIQRHRDKTSGRSRPTVDTEAQGTSAALRALTQRLDQQRRRHSTEISDLRRALAVAQGENLELRRRLAAHEQS